MTTRNGLIWLLFAAFLGVQALAGTQAPGIADVSEVEFELAGFTDGDDDSADAAPLPFGLGAFGTVRIAAVHFPAAHAAPGRDPAAASPWATGPPA